MRDVQRVAHRRLVRRGEGLLLELVVVFCVVWLVLGLSALGWCFLGGGWTDSKNTPRTHLLPVEAREEGVAHDFLRPAQEVPCRVWLGLGLSVLVGVDASLP